MAVDLTDAEFAQAAVAALRERIADHQVEVLVSLVGSNPVPAAVVARVLLADGGNSVLVHTAQSEKPARRVAGRLQAWNLPAATLSPVSSARPGDIAGRVAATDGLRDAKVTIDYTGGTKAMSVFSVVGVLGQKADAVSAYLDARTMSLILEQQFRETVIPIEGVPLLSLKDLLELHGWKLVQPAIEQPILPRTAAALAELWKRGQHDKAWRDWMTANGATVRDGWPRLKQQERDAAGKKKNTWVSVDRCDWPTGSLGAVVAALQAETGIEDSQFRPQAYVDQKLFPKVKEVLGWMHGKWLESHAQQQLLADGGAWQDRPVHHFEPYFKGTAINETKFELDVVATWGYQLHGVAVTTSAVKSTCKQKLFEAIHRARQLGGDEARVTLVCGATAAVVDEIKAQLSSLFKDDSVWVFGAAHLSDLGEQYRGLMEGTARERQDVLNTMKSEGATVL